MTISAETLRLLLQAGLEGNDLVDVVESIERDRDTAKPKSSAAIRQQRYRARKAGSDHSVTRDVTRDVTTKTPLDKEDLPQTPSEEINPQKEKTPIGVQKKTPQTILEQALSRHQAAAVIEHRRRIRKPLTDRAAELLAGKFSQAQSVGFTPDQAADLMISRGWQGFELDWAKNATPPASAPPLATTDEAWGKRLRFARAHQTWSEAELGPAPGKDGCRVPAHLLVPSDGVGWAEFKAKQAVAA